MHKHEAISICRSHMYRYVLVQTTDGHSIDGIIEHVDNDHVYLAVPIGPEDAEAAETRGYYPPYYPPYPPVYPGYYPPYFPRRRFRRVVLPLATLLGLSLLPYYY